MTLPKDVAGAADALDIYHGDAGSWKTIRAHLLSQDASNQRLREIGRKAVLANADLRQQTYVLESRLAAADALLQAMRTLYAAKYTDLVPMADDIDAIESSAEALMREWGYDE